MRVSLVELFYLVRWSARFGVIIYNKVIPVAQNASELKQRCISS